MSVMKGYSTLLRKTTPKHPLHFEHISQWGLYSLWWNSMFLIQTRSMVWSFSCLKLPPSCSVTEKLFENGLYELLWVLLKPLILNTLLTEKSMLVDQTQKHNGQFLNGYTIWFLQSKLFLWCFPKKKHHNDGFFKKKKRASKNFLSFDHIPYFFSYFDRYWVMVMALFNHMTSNPFF